MSKQGPAALWCALLAVSMLLEWLFERAAFPAALLVGSMVAAICFGVGGASIRVPRLAFVAAQALIGCLVARAITAPIVSTVAHDWALMLAVALTTIAAGVVVGWVLTRTRILPGTTALWGSSPGAAATMVALSEEFGADARLVAFMQYLRVVIVVMTASIVSRIIFGVEHPAVHQTVAQPLSARAAGNAVALLPLLETLAVAAGGALIARRLAIPGGAMLLPMAIGAALHATGLAPMTLPSWILGPTYVALGWYVGLAFNQQTVVYALRSVPALLVATFLLIGLCGLSAWALTAILHTDALTAYLATSPGGLDSVAIIALGTNADTPFVLALQTLRIVVVILAAPPLTRLIARRQAS